VVRIAVVCKDHTGRKYKKEQEIVTMHKLFALVAVVLLAGCSTVDSVIDGTKGIIGGVASDVVGVTSGTLDVVSGTIKGVAEKTGVETGAKDI
tara:strand:+ start:1261 stop:1539 length:279 start_codon:yes stop_codon:yes gene_type:complete